MIWNYGKLNWDLDPLIERVQSLPASSWQHRSDRESYETRVVIPGMTAWALVDTLIKDLLAAVEVQLFTPGYFNRLVLSCVPSGKGILPHTDDFGDSIRRISLHCHLPLITDPGIVIGCSRTGIETHLEIGNVYILDERQEHYVKNITAIDRVHLLFAYFPHDKVLPPVNFGH